MANHQEPAPKLKPSNMIEYQDKLAKDLKENVSTNFIYTMENQDKKAKELGAVLRFEMLDENESPVVGYFRKPTRKELMAVISISTKDAGAGSEVLFKNCFLKEVSDKRITEEDSFYLGALAQTGELIEMKQATIKKI